VSWRIKLGKKDWTWTGHQNLGSQKNSFYKFFQLFAKKKFESNPCFPMPVANYERAKWNTMG
jgi:hypothetical protein